MCNYQEQIIWDTKLGANSTAGYKMRSKSRRKIIRRIKSRK
jgi:hypothetical protein